MVSRVGEDPDDLCLTRTATGYEVGWWSAGEAFAQRFDPAGRRLGGVTPAVEPAPTETLDQVPLAQGWLRVWEQFHGGETSWDVLAQSVTGVDDPVPWLLCDDCRGAQRSPAVAANPAGSRLVVWEHQRADGGGWDVVVRAVDRLGRPLGLARRLNHEPSGDPTSPRVVGLGDRFVVAWRSTDPITGAAEIRLRGTDDPIFADGFESGDASAWTAVITGPLAVLEATPSTGTVPLTVDFDASGSSDLSSTLTDWAWDFGDGTNASGVTASHTYTDIGDFSVLLTVTAADGETGIASTTISAGANNQPPTASFLASPGIGDVPLTVFFDGSGSTDADGSVVDWAWDFGDGSTGSGETAIHTYLAEGSFTATLTVTDDLDATAMVSTVLTVEPANLAPTAVLVATPVQGQAPLEVGFDATGSTDPDGILASFAWDFGDGQGATGSNPSHTYGAAGVYSVTLTVTDDGGDEDVALTTVIVSAPQPSVPEVDPVTSPTLDPVVTLTGSADAGATIEIVGGTTPVTTSADGAGAFSTPVTLGTNRVNTLYVTAIDALGQRSAPQVVEVVHDATPPSLFIDVPLEGAVVTSETVTVGGRVGDLLSGFLGLSVEVEGVAANVVVGVGTNGTFDRAAVPLALGDNTLEVTATDALGNTTMRSVTLTRVEPTGARLEVVSGDAQTAPVGMLLPEPVVLRVLDGAGQPFADKWIDLTVDRSDGGLGLTSAGGSNRFIQVRTDAAGLAEVYWTLGSDAGCANNRLTVRSTDIAGSLLITASGRATAATQIHVGSGGQQMAEVGGITVEPLRVWVSDGRNGVAGVPVTFTAFDGAQLLDPTRATVPSTMVSTGLTGHVEVSAVLGPDPGRQRVEASFAGNTGTPVVFQLDAVGRNPEFTTSLRGRVVDNAERGIGGAVCHLEVAGMVVETTTDASGAFVFEGLAAGPGHLEIDGLVATTAGGDPVPPGSFPALGQPVLLVPEVTNTLPDVIRLPGLDPANARVYDGTVNVTLTVAGIEGLSMTVAAGSMRRADGSLPSPADPAVLALNPVHIDDIPMPMPDGAAPAFAWTLQPAGATFDPPVAVSMPNMNGLAPGSAIFLLTFDHATERFEIVGTGRVSADGARLDSDPGSGLTLAGWGGGCPPYPDTTTGDVEPEDVEEVDDDCENDGRGFFGFILGAFKSQRRVCDNLPSMDEDPIGYVNGLQRCRRHTLRCAAKAGSKASTLPGTAGGGPINSKFSLFGAIYGLFFADDPPPPGDDRAVVARRGAAGGLQFTILEEENYRVNEQLPMGYSRFLVEVIDVTSGVVLEEARVLPDLQEFGLGPHSFAGIQVLQIDGPVVTAEVHVFDPDAPPTVLATVGNQSSVVPWDGPFAVPNVASPAGTLLRPRFTFLGDGVEYAIASPFFVEAVNNGTTPLKFPSTAAVYVPQVGITLTPASTVLTALGEPLQLTTTALLADGTTTAVTERVRGTVYTTSNPEIASVDDDGLVTSQGRGIAFVTASSEGASATVRVLVSPGDPRTTVEGFVQTPDGTFLADARVTLTEQELTTVTDAAGRFVFEEVASELSDSLTVTARGGSSAGILFGRRLSIVPVPAGITDAGILVLEAVFDLPDGDGDGVADVLEELLGTDPANPDSDGDGTVDGAEDADGDGLTDLAELLLGTDPGIPDSDGNGTADGAEDTDRDGLTDGAEVAAGTNPYHHDTDGDGFADGDEVLDGSDPRDATSLPRSLTLAPVVSVRNLSGSFLEPGRARGPVITVHNLVGPVVEPGRVAGGALSVLNQVGPGVESGQVLSLPVSVRNTETPQRVVGEAQGPVFSVDNEGSP